MGGGGAATTTLLQAAVEAEEPALAAPLRTAIFRRFWHGQANIARTEDLASPQQQAGVDPAEDRFLDHQQLERLTDLLGSALAGVDTLQA